MAADDHHLRADESPLTRVSPRRSWACTRPQADASCGNPGGRAWLSAPPGSAPGPQAAPSQPLGAHPRSALRGGRGVAAREVESKQISLFLHHRRGLCLRHERIERHVLRDKAADSSHISTCAVKHQRHGIPSRRGQFESRLGRSGKLRVPESTRGSVRGPRSRHHRRGGHFQP